MTNESAPPPPPSLAGKLFRSWTVRGTFILFVAASIALHLMLAGSGVVSEKIAKARELQAAEAKRQEILAKKEAVKLAKAELEKKAVEQTKEDVKEKLKDQFDALVAKDLKPDVSQEVWDKLLAKLQGQLEDTAENVGDEKMTDAEVQAQMQALEGAMLDDLLSQLREMGSKKLAESYVDRIKTDIAPKLAAHFNTQIDRKIGTALKEAGNKIIAEDAAAVRAERAKAPKTPGVPKDTSDPTLAARRGIRDARDSEIKKQIDESFDKEVAEKTIPKLADELTDAFKKTLDDANIKDDATVADVRKKVGAALGEKVKSDVNAGETGTGQLTKAGRLNEAGNGPAGNGPAGNGPAGKGATTQVAGAGAGKVGTGAAGTGAAGAGAATTGAAGNAEAGTGAAGKTAAGKEGAGKETTEAKGDAHENAAAEKMKLAAKGITEKGMGDVAGDGGAEKIVAGATGGKAAGADGPDGMNGLANRVARLSAMLKNGEGETAGGGDGDGAGAGGGGAAAGGGGAGGAPGPGSGGGGGFSSMRESAFARSRAASLIRADSFDFDKKRYDEMVAAMQARDAAAARGQKIALESAKGDAVLDITSLVEAAKEHPQPASIITPAVDPKTPPVGIAEKKDPYKPAFDNISFAAIPYRTKPIVIDGDLSEWADVPAIDMVAVTPKTATAAAGLAQNAPPLKIKIQWDSTGFYIAYEVKKADPEKITKVKPGDFWQGDGAEIWIDPLNTKDKVRTELTQQFWAWVDGSVDDPTITGGEAVSYNRHEERNAFHKDLLQVASKKTADGWTMEVHIPKERIHQIDMEPGRIMGMNFSICTGSSIYYYWAGTTKQGTAMSPDTWGDVLLAGSDAKLEAIDRLTSELKQTETAKPLAFLRVGDPLRIRVTSTVMNLSDLKRDKVAVSVASRHGGRQEVILEETGNSTGIFEGAIPTALETGDPILNTLSLYEGEPIDITYNDQCRANGSRNVKVKLTLPTASSIGKLVLK